MFEPPRKSSSQVLGETVRVIAFFIGISVLSGLFGASLIGLLALFVT
ncbi:MAG: hypothetical protein H0W08_01955 [Acidobacteria bacterium]|jgi:hypothetical protein|nr:hypothetical protein [Acidobacteriota bacterium]